MQIHSQRLVHLRNADAGQQTRSDEQNRGPLLQSLEARRIILTGFASNICVLYTAADAHVRGFEVVVPADCVAAEEESIHRFALEEMERSCHARITTAEELARCHSGGTPTPRRAG